MGQSGQSNSYGVFQSINWDYPEIPDITNKIASLKNLVHCKYKVVFNKNYLFSIDLLFISWFLIRLFHWKKNNETIFLTWSSDVDAVHKDAGVIKLNKDLDEILLSNEANRKNYRKDYEHCMQCHFSVLMVVCCRGIDVKLKAHWSVLEFNNIAQPYNRSVDNAATDLINSCLVLHFSTWRNIVYLHYISWCYCCGFHSTTIYNILTTNVSEFSAAQSILIWTLDASLDIML